MKYIFRILTIQNGEYQYYSKSVHKLEEHVDPAEFLDQYARDFYGDNAGDDVFNDGACLGTILCITGNICPWTVCSHKKFLRSCLADGREHLPGRVRSVKDMEGYRNGKWCVWHGVR